jgi:hypothetical protein
LNIPYRQIINIEPHDKVWFSLVNGSVYALPLFGDYSGPFHIHLFSSSRIDLKVDFDIAPSTSLFSPSNHLLRALFNTSSMIYKNSSFNRYAIVQTLALALNVDYSLLTIHRVNGSMMTVYFSCDFYRLMNLTEQIRTLIDHYYSRRLQLTTQMSLPLIEISIVRLTKTLVESSSHLHLRAAVVTVRTPLVNNRTDMSISSHFTADHHRYLLEQFYRPLVLVPLIIIVLGLVVCSFIAICLCCHRRSSSSSTLLLPSDPLGTANNQHLYQNYAYRKHRQQQEIYKKKRPCTDQRQFISKGTNHASRMSRSSFEHCSRHSSCFRLRIRR